MLENVQSVDDLRALARARARPYLQTSVHPKLVSEHVDQGWSVVRNGKVSVRLRRDKPHGVELEDRVWTLIYRLGLTSMSGAGGARLRINDSDGPATQIDVVGVDAELALAIECKSAEKLGRRPQFVEELAKLVQLREKLTRAVASQFQSAAKRHLVLAFFVRNVTLSDNDRERARTANVVVFDDKDLEYYETLVAHLGPAAKYQLFADMLPGKTIAGLEMRVPAIKTRMGPHTCYTFPVAPEYLLKIAYVSHRSKGKASDVHTYQRMVARSRLKKIRDYITARGIFPTNIVLNIDKRFLTFHRLRQENDKDDKDASGVLGWLDVRPAYKSAWVIDGQHRLYAFSGHPFAKSGHLSVLAFEGIAPSVQARLFIDINSKQKSVSPSLLQELLAELQWDAVSLGARVQAIVSKVVQVLDQQKESPLFGRIQTADATRDELRCISLTTVFRAIERQGFFVAKEADGEVIEGGPFWAPTSERVLARTVKVLAAWFGRIRDGAQDWWDLGAGEGGGLAMNDSITACIMVLRSVIQHLEGSGHRLVRLDDDDVVELLEPWATALGKHLGSLGVDERKLYRDLRGVQGQTTRMRRCQQALKTIFPKFVPPGLDEFLRREKAETNSRAKAIIDRIEILVQRLVLQELKQEFAGDADSWWIHGIPKAIRVEASRRSENDDHKRGSREAYLDLIDYRTIVLGQWSLFQNLVGYGKRSDSKDKQTRWIVEVNEMRNAVAHASSGVSLPVESVAQLANYEEFLIDRVRVASDERDDGVERGREEGE